MPKIVVVAHNVWLIPFSAPWMFGRCERICNHQRMVVGKLRAEAGPDALMIVALQELWAFRTGPTWPLLWLVGKLQSKLLRDPRRSGGHEPVLLRIISGIVMALSCLFAWLPLPFGLWNPKAALPLEPTARSPARSRTPALCHTQLASHRPHRPLGPPLVFSIGATGSCRVRTRHGRLALRSWHRCHLSTAAREVRA